MLHWGADAQSRSTLSAQQFLWFWVQGHKLHSPKGLEEVSIQKPQTFAQHWTVILGICILDHEQELVTDHGETKETHSFYRGGHTYHSGRPSVSLSACQQCGRGRGTEGDCHFRETCVCDSCFTCCSGRVNHCWDGVQEQTRSTMGSNRLSLPRGHFIPVHPWA